MYKTLHKESFSREMKRQEFTGCQPRADHLGALIGKYTCPPAAGSRWHEPPLTDGQSPVSPSRGTGLSLKHPWE